MPGHGPHPDSSASHQAMLHVDGLFDPEIPESLRTYMQLLAGIDLYHDGYLWEAHEMWETPWMAAKAAEEPEQARFIRGLIFNTAGVLKAFSGRRRGALRHGQRAMEVMEDILADGRESYMGLALSKTLDSMRQFYTAIEHTPEDHALSLLDIVPPRLYHCLHQEKTTAGNY